MIFQSIQRRKARPRMQGLVCVGAILLALSLGACSLAPAQNEVASYDFGTAPSTAAAVRLTPSLLILDVAAPTWMDTGAVHYRLAYQDATRPRPYASSRWVMPPAALVTQRLRQRFASASSGGILVPADGLRAAYSLRIEIEEFAQVFDAPGNSRAVLRVRASLLGSRALVAQHTFSLERSATTPDAVGGVRALIAASDDLIAQLLEWTAANAKQ